MLFCMNNRSLIFSILIVLSFLLCGCDPVRGMLGLPTSQDIESKKALILADKAEEQAAEQEAAAIARAKKYTADSLSALGALQEASCVLNKRSQLRVSIMSEVPSKYSIVAGAFSTASNADKLCSELSQEGFKTIKLAYRSGLTAVAVNPTDDIVEIAARYSQLRGKKLIPEESWILVNE